MLYLIFGLAALFTILCSIKIAAYADIIRAKTKLNVVFVGLLLGGATSLPEITTSITSVIVHNPDLAVGNMIGSNLFNMLILALWTVYFYRRKILFYAEREHVNAGLATVVLSCIITLALQFETSHTLLGIGLDTVVLFLFYSLFMYLLSKEETTPEEEINEAYHTEDIRRVSVKFGLAALFIMAMGSILTIAGDRIAIATGIGASFIGSFLIAASTSLPEAVSCYAAIKLNSYKLAISSILGSNLFNIAILAGTDIIYLRGNLFADAHPIHYYSSIMTIVLSLLVIRGLTKRTKSNLSYLLPSLLIIGLYLFSTYYIFINA